MTNKYWNHDNPFMPGTVVRADEANDKFDGIEVGFDRIEGITNAMALQIKTEVMADVQPQIDTHKADTQQQVDNIRVFTQSELAAFQQLLTQINTDVTDKLSHVMILPDGAQSLEITKQTITANQIPYINSQGNADLLAVPDVAIPADWTKVYLGRSATPPTKDLNGNPLREGAMYFNTTDSRLEVYRNGAWVPGFISGHGVVTVASIEPPNPEPGDLWFDTQTADLMLWYDDGTSVEWVVVNSNYNALFGPGVGPILKDGSIPMQAPLALSSDPPGPDDAISRTYLEDFLRRLGGPSTIMAPHVTSGVDPRVNFPVQPGTADYEKPYDVRIAGTILFFGNYGALNNDYNLGNQIVTPGDYVISTGREWILIEKGGGGFIAAADLSQPVPQGYNLGDLVGQDFFTHNGGPNVAIHPSWLGAGGATVNPGDTVVWDGTAFHVVPELRNLDRYLLRDGSFPMQGSLLMDGHTIKNLGTPVDPSDAVTLTFLQNFGSALLVPWAQVTGKPATFPPTIGTTAVTAAPGDHLHDGRYFQKTEFVDATAGVTDAGKPVILDSTGHIPTHMVTLPSYTTFKGTADPANLPANPGLGDFYVLNASGMVNGVNALSGDMIVWDGNQWNVIAAEAELASYLLLDGSRPMGGKLSMGGFAVELVGNPVAQQDAVNLRYLEQELQDYLLIDGTRAMTGDLDFGTFKGVQLADADPTEDYDAVNIYTLHDQAFQKTEHINTSAGAADAGKPIVLGSIGRIPINMLSLPSVLEYKGTVAPGGLPANPATGDVVVFNAIGVENGINVHPGDWALYDGTIWEIVPAIQDLSIYVNRDGSAPMIGAFNAGGFLIHNVAGPPVADTDAANKKYVDDQLRAGTVTWATLMGKPATFPPTIGLTATTAAAGNHAHAWADITGKPTTFPPTIGTSAATAAAGNHAHAWGDITGKPTNWAWANISGKPATFPPTIGTTATTAAAGNHAHAWAAITGKPTDWAWANISGKPATFPPTIGTTATTAAAGNHNHTGVYLPLAGGQLTGNLGIKVAPAEALHVNGQIVATNDITAFYSDVRLKTIHHGIEHALERVCSLEGFVYSPNDKAREIGAAKDNKLRLGLSAQEVAAQFPEAVSPAPFDMRRNEKGELESVSGEDYKTVDYAKLVPALVEAIKELKQEIEDLKNA